MKLQLYDKDNQTTAVVTLSRRNLLTLLHKLDMPGSRRMLYTQHCELDGRLDDDLLLVIRVEDDIEHYGKRGFGPGLMHPLTEVFVAAAETVDGGSSRAEPAVKPETPEEFEAPEHGGDEAP